MTTSGRRESTNSPTSSFDKSMLSLTLDEGEVEANLYFPTFARRGSEVTNLQRSSTSARLLLGLDPSGEDDDGSITRTTSREVEAIEDDDEIFALDHELIEEDTIDGMLSYSFNSRGKTERRISDQSISSTSTSTNDIDMVWDEEEDQEPSRSRDDTIRASVKMVREGSGSSAIQAPFSPKWTRQSQEDVNLKRIPSLTFARTMRRPSENPLNTYQWGMNARGSTTIVSRSNSVTSIHFDPLSRDLKKHTSGAQSATNSPQTDRGNPFASPCTPTKLEASKKSMSEDQIVGRKRRCTDPLIFRTMLGQYKMTHSKSSSKEQLHSLVQS
jgi:hypothetical protein